METRVGSLEASTNRILDKLDDISNRIDHVHALIEGGKVAASVLRWVAGVAVGCAAAYAWVGDHLNRIVK